MVGDETCKTETRGQRLTEGYADYRGSQAQKGTQNTITVWSKLVSTGGRQCHDRALTVRKIHTHTQQIQTHQQRTKYAIQGENGHPPTVYHAYNDVRTSFRGAKSQATLGVSPKSAAKICCNDARWTALWICTETCGSHACVKRFLIYSKKCNLVWDKDKG